MEQKYKVLTINTNNSENREILDIEEIRAEDLRTATELAKSIQTAELKQNAIESEKIIEDYEDAYIDVANNVGIVQSGKQNILLIVGENNAWFYLVNNSEMSEIDLMEWNDFINEILNKEPGEKDLIEL